MLSKCVTAVVLAMVALAVALPASAQITTASVTGTVKDPQGGVIPGATVTLISETQGTQLSDVFTNSNGDFTFANVKPDRYTLQITMEGFKTLKKSGIVVSAGDRTILGGTAACRRSFHGRRRSTCRTSASTATTRSTA